MIFRSLRHLIPAGRAWKVTIDKNLRQLLKGLSGAGDDAREFVDSAYNDLNPEKTRALSLWENQFALLGSNLSESARRSRLDAAWKDTGGQDPRYIEDTLRARGFDVYVHEWWEPGSEPAVGVQSCATPRNPILYIRREFTNVDILVECGEALAQCGEEFAEAGNSLQPRGYPLVNKVVQTVPDVEPLCGEALAQCGEALAECGNYTGLREEVRTYIVPNDPEKWPYFLYIGGQTFGDIAQIPPSRRDEFENLALKICPTQQWLGILVEYV